MTETASEYSDLIDRLSVASNAEPVWIRVGTLVDGERREGLRDAHLVYDAQSILHAGTALPPIDILKPGQSEPNVHLPDHTVLPGLIEAHAHLFLEGGELNIERRSAYLKQDRTALLDLVGPRFERLVSLGVMAVRDAGDRDGVGLALAGRYRDRDDDSPLTPYIDSPGAAIHRQGRYGKFMGEALELHESSAGCVQDRVDAGAHRIKLIPTGIIDFKAGKVTAAPQMTADDVTTLVEAARAHGKQTFAHASGSDGIENAIEGGVDSVEHGFFLTDEQLGRMRDRNTAWVPTFAPVQEQVDHAEIMGWDETVVGHLRRILENHARSLCLAVDMGVPVIAGSDAGSYGVAHGHGLLGELELMERAGLASIDVIRAATGVSAGRLGFDESFGVLESGRKSRFLLTRYDPLSTVAELRGQKLCVFDGRAVEGPTLGGSESEKEGL
jgi:imidazolonepropionase-like amidohydrolase